MKLFILAATMLTSYIAASQSIKPDTLHGVVVYTGTSNIRHIAGGNYHTYTEEATLIRTDTGIISIKTEFGFLDLSKNFEFIPMNKLQPARLKVKP